MPPIGLPQPLGTNGWKLASCTRGSASTMNTVSAMTLTSTRKVLTIADLEVPKTSSSVITTPIRKASRLNEPPSRGPARRNSGRPRP